LSQVSATILHPARGAGSSVAALPDLQLRHLLWARRRLFHVDGGRSRTLSSGTSWILDEDRWWPLLEKPPAPPKGPTIDVSNFGGGRCRIYRQHPWGARHRRLHLRWWSLPNLAASTLRGSAIDVFNFTSDRCRTLPSPPPGGLLSTFSTSVVAAAGPCRQHPLGGLPSTSSTSVVAAVGPCRQHPLGAHDRCLQLRWWPLSDLAVSTS
jgi:hypothetical protein